MPGILAFDGNENTALVYASGRRQVHIASHMHQTDVQLTLSLHGIKQAVTY